MNLQTYLEQNGAAVRGGPGWTRLRCPFHDDRTPSASVNFTEGRFNCFSCGINEDLIGLLMSREGMTYTQAVEAAEEDAGTGGDAVSREPGRRRNLPSGTRHTVTGGAAEPLWSRLFP